VNEEYGSPFNDNNFQACWYFWIATRQNLSEAWNSIDLTCPLARGGYKRLLAAAIGELSEHCEAGIKNNSCGSLKLGSSAADHPNCPWKQHLQHIGFVAV
jgi:hypothetical protein